MISKIKKGIYYKHKMLIIKYAATRLLLISLPLIFCGSASVNAYSYANGVKVIKKVTNNTAMAPLNGGYAWQLWHQLSLSMAKLC